MQRLKRPKSHNICRFATKGLPSHHESFAASAGKTGRTSIFSYQICNNFLGGTMVPKSQMWQNFPTILLYKPEQFTLNCRQTFLAITAKVYDELQQTTPCLQRSEWSFQTEGRGSNLHTMVTLGLKNWRTFSLSTRRPNAVSVLTKFLSTFLLSASLIATMQEQQPASRGRTNGKRRTR
jgi:hypothetical protein